MTTPCPKIQVLVATIASGKSTYARNAAAEGYVVVNDDSIVTALHGGDYRLYHPALKPLYKGVENHVVTAAIALRRPVVIDRGVNLNARSRKRWLGLAASLDVPCEAIVFPFEEACRHALRRYESEPRGRTYDYWLAVATAHGERYSPVGPWEDFDTVTHVTWTQIRDGLVL